ncbi:hypothetical protein KA529_02655 [Candidatus Saccharibacteria bacterium]|nr:hypothetical protein [Candidatus Saccharibacteria bacterium]
MKKLNNQQGVVSFFTVIFITLLLLILTTAYIRLMVNEQRQATDNDLSSRAFYAAESGVNDAILKIKKELQSGDLSNIDTDVCGPEKVLSSEAEADISYTCQFISLDSTKLTGTLEKDQSLVLDLTGKTGEDSQWLSVSWHTPRISGEPYRNLVPGLSAGQNRSDWSSKNIPAIMRLQAITFPDTPTLQRSDITNRISFGYPTTSDWLGAGDFGKLLSIDSKKGPSTPTCMRSSDLNDFTCKLTFTSLGGQPNKFLKLQALNNSTDYEVSLIKPYYYTVDIPNQVATIDVTGKAGNDVFRRVRVTVPINDKGGPADAAILPDQVLLVDKIICKDFEVSSGIADKFGCNYEQ